MYVSVQGALTHGDRRATETRDLSRFNIDNRVCTSLTLTLTLYSLILTCYSCLKVCCPAFETRAKLRVPGT